MAHALDRPASFFSLDQETFSNHTLNLWNWIVLGAPLWWVLGLNLMIYHLAALFLFLRMALFCGRQDRGIFLPTSCFFIFVLILTYLVSIIIHASAFPASRVVASFYNLTFWMMGLLLIVVMANSFPVSKIPFFLKTFSALAWMMGLLGGIMFVVGFYARHAVIFSTPLSGLSRYVENADLLMQSVSVPLLIEDWFASFLHLRFNALSPYPTATGGLLMMILMMILTSAAMENRSQRPLFILLFALNFFALLMTLSRMSVLVFVLSLAIVFLLQQRRAFFWTVLLLSVVVFAGPWILKIMDVIWGLRQGSSETRFALYQYSLQELEGADWILGLGIKDRGAAFIFPIGSHSTYVSLCVKSGIVGLSTFLLFQISLLHRWFQLRDLAILKQTTFCFWRGLGWIFFAMAIWTMTEDLDAPQLVAFLYFSLVGVFEGMQRELSQQ